MNLFGHDLLAMMASHGYLLLFLIVLVEEAGIPLPIPGDLFLLFTGSLVAQGVLGFGPAFLLVSLATLIGASILYTVALHGGRPLLRRYGRWLRIKDEQINRAERWLNRRPFSGVAIMRLIPGLRIHTTMVAGMLAVPRPKATISVILAGMIWTGGWLGAGMLLGPNVYRAAHMLSRVDKLFLPVIGAALAVVVLLWLIRQAYRRYRGAWTWRGSWVAKLTAGALRPRAGSAAIGAFALVVLLIAPPLVSTIDTDSGRAEAKNTVELAVTQAHPAALTRER